eukprot:gnl/Dysnectes_brevis/1305_a1461_2871.p1 GENE.gnl/Dysnectes_brevis/1305_a1461_2871~~gnl/Dysnectes_brevis/1305_a1461_2871.p1  ORF type:complete len:266 (-),score=78.54 gnl/Dysnectes_brevis/1305_a1461_2871:37-834(-)
MEASMEPIEVLYCDICSAPVEYCQHRRKHAECEQWLKEAFPEVWKDIYAPEEEVQEDLEANPDEAEAVPVEGEVPVEEEAAETEAPAEEAVAVEVVEEPKVVPVAPPDWTKLRLTNKNVPEFGVKPKHYRKSTTPPVLQVRLARRGGKKAVTQIFGWRYFESMDTTEATTQLCALLKKRCACGVSTATLQTTGHEIITVQGDFVDEVIEVIKRKFTVPHNLIWRAKDGKLGGRKKGSKKKAGGAPSKQGKPVKPGQGAPQTGRKR